MNRRKEDGMPFTTKKKRYDLRETIWVIAALLEAPIMIIVLAMLAVYFSLTLVLHFSSHNSIIWLFDVSCG